MAKVERPTLLPEIQLLTPHDRQLQEIKQLQAVEPQSTLLLQPEVEEAPHPDDPGWVLAARFHSCTTSREWNYRAFKKEDKPVKA